MPINQSNFPKKKSKLQPTQHIPFLGLDSPAMQVHILSKCLQAVMTSLVIKSFHRALGLIGSSLGDVSAGPASHAAASALANFLYPLKCPYAFVMAAGTASALLPSTHDGNSKTVHSLVSVMSFVFWLCSALSQ